MMVMLLTACLMQAAAPAQESSTTATVGGRVLDADTGRPLAGMSVMLRLMRQNRQLETRTDAEGRYEFAGMPAQPAVLEASAGDHGAIYVPGGFSEASPQARGVSLELRAGEVREDVDLRLWRARAISGRVVDDAGEPLANASIRVFRAPGGQSLHPSSREPRSDDRGQFRVFGLQPGRYFVCAVFRQSITFQDFAATTSVRRPVTTCHPSATEDDLGSAIVVGRGDVDGVEIRATRYSTVTITGTVIDADGQPAEGAQVMLSTSWRGQGGGSGWSVPAGGRFTIGDVTPGRYGLSASIGAKQYPGEPERDLQYAEIELHVGPTDVTNVTVVLRRAVNIRGRLLFDAPVPPGGMSRWRVQPAGRSGISRASAEVAVDEDGRFELMNVVGPQVISVSSPGGWIVESIRWRGQDITDLRTEFDDRPGGELHITVSNRPAILSGYVTDAAGVPVTSGRVIVALADKARWRPRASPQALITKDGRFTAQPRRAGEYLVVALSVDDYERLGDEPSFELIESLAERVLLLENDRRVIDLRLAMLPALK